MPEQDEADIQQPPYDHSQPEVATAGDATAEAAQPAEVAPEVAPPAAAETQADPLRPVAQLAEGEGGHPLLISAHASDNVSAPIAPDATADSEPETGPEAELDTGPEAEAEAEAEAVEPAEPPAPVIEPRRFSRAERDALDRQQRRFAACGRCGYFIADCRVSLGEDALADAILDSRDGWVRMVGDKIIHKMVAEAYGVALDLEFDSFDGTCPECRRRFVVITPEAGPTRLKIRV